ncbi:glycoside hydrolase family 31 protein [Salimicrobium halophilum]|uniref:Alpha-glucosidase n=1 Tax=Salimicrobium halophilum TaxID=86666 RepID=A0A1G8T294_9BACI|nr:TIM-barrel domain-containing protein [Salimicrobium halophilum]SDJ35729.1 alpha-glucosidase [Salimicrobium halophilum]
MLEHTSYAILPSDAGETEEQVHEVGSVESVKWDGEVVEGTLTEGAFFLYLLNDQSLRFSVHPFDKVSRDSTLAVLEDEPVKDAEFSESDAEIFLSYKDLQVTVEKSHLSITAQRNGKTVFQLSNVSFNKHKKVFGTFEKDFKTPVYGLGEKSGFLNKNGEKITNWNTDVFAPHNKDTVELYQSIPFAVIHEPGEATTGVFLDNSHRTEFDMQTFKDRVRISAEGGPLNTYIILGEDIKDTLRGYTTITGTTPLPPQWSLGYHQSRYSYRSEEEVREVAAAFEKYEIPLDCIFLDIHYMNDYRVFTFDKDRFPNAGNLIKELDARGIDVVPIVDPGVKKDVEYPVYREGVSENFFSTYIDGSIYYGEVWPGVSAFPDFFQSRVQKWWGHLHGFYTEKGIRGIWNDMNEPSVFNETKTMDLDVMHNQDGKLISHKEGHNLYGLYMSKATFEGLKELIPNTRPFSLTRAGYAGVQRYSAVWTGDNRSHWEHLEMSLPMIMNLGMSGVAFSGADVGGFASDCTPELLIRWTQVGAFLPYFRNHSVQDSIYQEPWAFNEETMTIVKKFIQLRYEFMPYLYTLFHEAEKSGVPVVRPLIMEYPDDKEATDISDQFLLGRDVMVAPMLRPGQTHRSVYFPNGTWFDWWSGEEIEGGKFHLVYADIDTIPVFVKAGTVLPLGNEVKNTKERQRVRLIAFSDGDRDMKGQIYEDDHISYKYLEGKYVLTDITLSSEGVVKTYKQGDFESNLVVSDIKIIGK